MNYDVNLAHCIVTANNFGSTWYTNICNGNVTKVPWGTVDWLSALAFGGLMGTILLVLTFALAGLCYTMYEAWRAERAIKNSISGWSVNVSKA